MSKLRVGIVGTGSRGVSCFAKAFVESHADSVEVVAFADPNTVRARKGAALLGISPDIHDNAHDLVSRKDIDAVVIASIDCQHEEHALAALRHDKHVYVEKPLATTVDGCLRIIEEFRRRNSVLSMGFNLRHHPVMLRLKKMADEEAFGTLFSVQAIEHYAGGRTYHSRWNRLKKNTGGLFIHKGSHDFDGINHLMGRDVRPARVACFANVFSLRPDRLPFLVRDGVEAGPRCGVCPYKDECPDFYPLKSELYDEETAAVDGYWPDQCMFLSDKDTHDQGIAIVEYDNGATASHSEYFATSLGNRQYMLEGTKGHASANLRDLRITQNPRWSDDRIDVQVAPQSGSHGGSDPDIIQTFLNCIKTGTQPSSTAVDGLWSVAVGAAAEKSRETGRTVEIRELMNPDSDLAK